MVTYEFFFSFCVFWPYSKNFTKQLHNISNSLTMPEWHSSILKPSNHTKYIYMMRCRNALRGWSIQTPPLIPLLPPKILHQAAPPTKFTRAGGSWLRKPPAAAPLKHICKEILYLRKLMVANFTLDYTDVVRSLYNNLVLRQLNQLFWIISLG